jgi:small subunit ribosomal protein S21
MIIIKRNGKEKIDQMLRRYKKKHRDIGIIKDLRDNKEFTKPSVKRRKEKLKAKYLNSKESKD